MGGFGDVYRAGSCGAHVGFVFIVVVDRPQPSQKGVLRAQPPRLSEPIGDGREKGEAGTFDKTFELLNALADKRKRDVESSSSASDLSFTDVNENTFFANLSPAEKEALRKAVLKQALIHHL